MKEGKTCEFKEKISDTFLKTVSAFANFGGGKILFGIDDNGNVKGIEDIKEGCLSIENKINDCIKPKPDYEMNVINGNVIELEVFKGSSKPYFYNSKAYKRSDTSTVEVDELQLKRLIMEGSNLFYDQLPSGDEQLSFTYLEKKLREIIKIPALDNDILRSLGFYTKDMKYNNAASIFADKNNMFGVDIVRFGNSINEILDRETIYKNCILEQYDRALILYRKYYQYEVIEGALRERRERLPESAFREALANALVHRDFDVNAHIRIAMFKNKIEISSPGGLPSSIKKEDYLNGTISVLKNPIIGNIFFRLDLIETLGTGIRRINLAYRDYDIKPDYMIFDTSITVELPTTTVEYEITGEESDIVDALRGGRILTCSEITDKTEYNKSKVLRLMKNLTDKKYVSVIGGGRSTKYKLR